jgi:hypothetical protein
MKNHFSMAFGNQFSPKRRTKGKHTSWPIAAFQSEELSQGYCSFPNAFTICLTQKIKCLLLVIVIAAVSMTPLCSSTQTCLTYDESIKTLCFTRRENGNIKQFIRIVRNAEKVLNQQRTLTDAQKNS